MRAIPVRLICLTVFCTLHAVDTKAQEAVFWPNHASSRQAEPAYRQKGKSKYSKTRKYKLKKRVPINYRQSDRTLVHTAQGNQAHIEYYYTKRDNTPYQNLQPGMIYNRPRNPEKRYKPRKR